MLLVAIGINMIPIQSIHDKKPAEKFVVSLLTDAIPVHYQYMLREHKYLRMFKNYQNIHHSITFHYAPFSHKKKKLFANGAPHKVQKYHWLSLFLKRRGSVHSTFHQSSHLVSCDLSAASGGGGISSLSRLIFDFSPSSVHKSPVRRR
jgi:hypothetical protein